MITENTLLDYAQNPLYPETLIERLFYDSSLLVSGNHAVAKAFLMDSSTDASIPSYAGNTGPLIFDIGTFQGYKVSRPTLSGSENPVMAFFNHGNGYTVFNSLAFDASTATGASYSKLDLKYEHSHFDISTSTNGLTLLETFDAGFFDSSIGSAAVDSSVYVRTKVYTSSPAAGMPNYVTKYMSREEFTKIELAQSTPSTPYYLVGVDSSMVADASTNRMYVASGASTEYVYWKDYNIYQTSDINLKKPVAGLDFDLDDLKAIDKFKFVWRHEPKASAQIGVSAQSVEKLFPEVVTEVNGIKGVAYDKLSVIALAAIDKLVDKIGCLEDRIGELEDRLARLEGSQPVVLGGGETEL